MDRVFKNSMFGDWVAELVLEEKYRYLVVNQIKKIKYETCFDIEARENIDSGEVEEVYSHDTTIRLGGGKVLCYYYDWINNANDHPLVCHTILKNDYSQARTALWSNRIETEGS